MQRQVEHNGTVMEPEETAAVEMMALLSLGWPHPQQSGGWAFMVDTNRKGAGCLPLRVMVLARGSMII